MSSACSSGRGVYCFHAGPAGQVRLVKSVVSGAHTGGRSEAEPAATAHYGLPVVPGVSGLVTPMSSLTRSPVVAPTEGEGDRP